VIFVFELVYIVDYIDGFLYIKPFLHPWNETYLVGMDDCFDVFLDSVSEKFIVYFCINICKGNWSEVLYLCWVFCDNRFLNELFYLKENNTPGYIPKRMLQHITRTNALLRS
jgi:restriction endonuclease S subunit